MKPVIGITADLEKEYLKLKMDYVRAVASAGGLPFIIAPVFPLPLRERVRVRGDYVSAIANAIDGLLLSGGGDIPPEYYGETISVPSHLIKPVEKERIDFEIKLFKEVMKRQKPILAICCGMQMVNVVLGGSLYQDIKLQVKPVPVGSKKRGAKNHKQGNHNIRLSGFFNSTLNIKHSTLPVNSSHHQAIKNLGKGLEVFAISEDGIIEGLYKIDYPFLVCMQWHPERDLNKDISSALFRSFIDASKRKKCAT